MHNFPVETQQIENLPHGLDLIVNRRLASSFSRAAPFFVHMLGVPGAGKSVIARMLYGTITSWLPEAPSYVGFDRLMAEIPAYQDTPDIVEAFAKYELPARAAGYALLKELISKRASIFLDHGGSAAEHPEILRLAKRQFGYRIYVVSVEVDNDICQSRIEARAKAEGRHTPPDYISERALQIEEMVPEYTDISDQFFAFKNNTQSDLVKIVTDQSLKAASIISS
ncbi:zeta toxin family protein [Henriciella sp. AS95]|uniref:zeta toxin family protein n=1 Tax=Henriciella sp. AS95 TaxID=3135782 RepID=UPI00317BB8D0